MNAPTDSSIALSVRETRGLSQGNGVSVEVTKKDNCVAVFLSVMRCAPQADSKAPNFSFSYFAVGLRKCSGRGPIPIKRAGSCRRIGNHFSKQSTNGNVVGSPDVRPVTTRR